MKSQKLYVLTTDCIFIHHLVNCGELKTDQTRPSVSLSLCVDF